ncbi:nucleotide-sugar transporter [Basidiobolus meristosporus CBS 931.73]|uniref:Nucleotide-sugar transporter n=1 Tax=Basidiobolus meristosporus CBS 931.73 TaxID=1314790 RepID=A0A1Y1XIU1_9FUNG|nr:nucleotide-sugar transporter [Basidiobolus meristosporus CBS 931.73]|eukprot:ORX85284.1 nucleotide-sugar transporter [Basidiobolus meristosporus CBS 931.73]
MSVASPHIPIKYVSLLILVVQNSALTLVFKYSTNQGKYATSTAVLLSELLKLVVCFTLVSQEDQPKRDKKASTLQRIFGPDSWKMIIPAGLYTIQNNLQYIAVKLLDPATFQVTYQLKILTTALFSVIMLRRQLSVKKWISLLLLTLGVILVKMSSQKSQGNSDLYSQRTLGFLAVICACLLSGLAGVYFEKILKGSQSTLWVRNSQLAFFSLFPALFLGVMWMDGESVRTNGFWYQYNIWTFGAIGCQAFGGIIVAMVVKYADNILKGFATSISIVISSVISIFLFNFQITPTFILGASLVIYSSYLYGLD